MAEKDHTAFTPFVVFGAAKSGTTWLQRVINAHPDCHCHFQVPIFPFTVEGRMSFRPKGIHTIYGKSKSPYNGIFKTKEEEQEYFWQNFYLKKLNFLQEGYLEKKMINKKDPSETEYLKSFHRKILASTAETILQEHAADKPRLGTKAVTDLEQLFYVFPEAKVLTIVRDGRDVVVSKRFHSMRMGVYMHGDEKSGLYYMMNEMLRFRALMNSLNKRFNIIKPEKHFKDLSKPENLLNKEVVIKFATEWHRKVDYIADFEERFPNNIRRIHFEELKEQPIEKMVEIFEFLGVPNDQKIIDQVVEATSFKSYEKTGKSSFFRSGKSGEWEKYFNDSHKAIFKEIAGPTLVRMGYEKDQNW